MSWPLREIPFPRDPLPRPEPGDCWRIPLDTVLPDWEDGEPIPGITTYEDEWQWFLSPEFRASGRDYVIVVRLPDGTDWVIDHASSRSLQDQRPQGWTVSGELPHISTTPSINVIGRYHGWVTDGILTDDCEGRTYP